MPFFLKTGTRFCRCTSNSGSSNVNRRNYERRESMSFRTGSWLRIFLNMNSRKKKIATAIALALGIGLIGGVATVSAVHSINLFELGPGLSSDEGGLTNILGDGNTANGPDCADICDANGNVVNL